MAAPTLHITVAAVAGGGDAGDLSHEARLVKAALLYADRVTLASVKAKMLEALSHFANAGDAGRDQFIEGALRVTENGPALLTALRELRRRPKGSLRPDEVIRLATIACRSGWVSTTAERSSTPTARR